MRFPKKKRQKGDKKGFETTEEGAVYEQQQLNRRAKGQKPVTCLHSHNQSQRYPKHNGTIAMGSSWVLNQNYRSAIGLL